ncbi:fish-egg lectin-like isoform X2 [Rana temporaria]|uniref:fish-egg lectin-like isoform X2 n=1 Tax=Rana temporaria TaxID=8407 RepID=UPI001AADD95E|nr:fish-egg lectin-like isoform X2 [Rana temporaria]
MLFAVGLLQLCAGISASGDFHCTLIPGKLKQIDAGAGEVYGVNDGDDIYRWVNNDWIQIPGKLIHVSVGPAGVWGVNKDNVIYKFQDNDWMSVPGFLKQVDAGGDKFLGGVNARNSIYCLRRSCTVSRSSVVHFTPLDGSVKYYSCGPLGCWGVNSANSIYFRHNVKPTSCLGTQWEHVDGSLAMIEVSTDGSVYGVNSAGSVYRRDGISAETPTGTSWTELDFCVTFKHVTYDNGYLWLLDPTGDIYRCEETDLAITQDQAQRSLV